jgi:hypothetical protein
MASSVLCGQSALVGLPTISKKKEREVSLLDVTIPSPIKVDRKRLKADESAGITVFKVAKVRRCVSSHVCNTMRVDECLLTNLFVVAFLD